jgi:hypothetical protein
MKYGILFFFLFAASTLHAQSLKDLLYGGKLKKDSIGVVRNTDDLSAKIDTATKKPEALVVKEKASSTDSSKNNPVTQQVTASKESATKVSNPDSTAVTSIEINNDSEETETPAANTPAKNNTRLWRDYVEALTPSLKSEVLTNKKIKKETYYLTVDYELSVDGTVDILNVSSSPENALLQSQVKERMMISPPQLNPVTNSTSTKKQKRKYNFNITKD